VTIDGAAEIELLYAMMPEFWGQSEWRPRWRITILDAAANKLAIRKPRRVHAAGQSRVARVMERSDFLSNATSGGRPSARPLSQDSLARRERSRAHGKHRPELTIRVEQVAASSRATRLCIA